ncbi:hypothetical protein GO755_26405 [Spirosoma sp. HMF4905]|uniref:AAA family ATPase n=1 Tax=Spirosoma arboris TaxID=2682092 RepID=A0A7K1SIP5_9BACT|nr:hypothetical protein [Spirosoma arboris]MVM33598.1 hypothetical protein [Spirosoma arboris]
MAFSDIGSVWRKWDLHVHTPFSALNNGFGSNWDVYVKNLFNAALQNNIHAIGITDYFTIEGYKKLKNDYLNNPGKLKFLEFDDEEINRINSILIIPNIEFRLDILIPTKKINNRINFHVLFSEEVPIIDIEENFLHELDFVYEGNPQSTDELRKLRVSNLISLGKKLKSEQQEFRNDSDLVVGMTTVVVNATQICKVLNKNIFKDKYVLAIPADEDLNQVDWRGQGHNTRKVLIQKSDFLMASNPNTIAWGLGQKATDIVKEFKSIKPSIWGSDAHNSAELFVKNRDRYLWIKSELNFDGLRQIIYEHRRVFIGIEPENKKHVELNTTNFIDRVKVNKINNVNLNEEWFDNIDIQLNPGLIAIIGNKGSGKTALADIIALCANAKKPKSFLNSERFNKSPEYKGKQFNATIHWRDGKINNVTLFDSPLESSPERVNYIPQSFLEKLCLPETSKGLFEKEIRKIIFSRIPNEKRLNKNSLDEIISFKTEAIRNNIEQTKSELKLLHDEILELESQNKPEYRQEIYDNIDAVNKKILVLIEKEPIEPSYVQSANVSEENIQINNEVNEYRALLEQIDEDIDQTNHERERLYLEIENINKSIQLFSSFKDCINRFVSQQKGFLAINHIDIDSIFKYKLDYSELEKLLHNKKDELEVIESKLDSSIVFDENFYLENENYVEDYRPTRAVSLYKIKAEIENDLTILQDKLDQPSKEYQGYLGKVAKWNQDLSDLRSELSKLEADREYVNFILEHLLTHCYKQREELLVKLFYQKSEIIAVYKELYEPVLNFKENYKKQLASYKIDFDAAFAVNGFADRFDSFINYAKSGSFYSRDIASKKINNLLNDTNFNDIDGVVNFVNNITRDLLYDTRNEKFFVAKNIQSQLKSNVRPEDVYNYIYGLEYLEPIFQLKLADKEISSLSPGERGALLLIFYLLLDKDQLPLIIDQPEENLDNQSIFLVLVPFIQKAKETRQVILVTHNPNLAVVCDADQVIHVKIDKNDNYRITCTAGSIENPIINELIVEVLEGTFPAFDTRNLRYGVTRSRLYRVSNRE